MIPRSASPRAPSPRPSCSRTKPQCSTPRRRSKCTVAWASPGRCRCISTSSGPGCSLRRSARSTKTRWHWPTRSERGSESMVRIVPTGQVAVGIQLPIQSQSTLYAEPWEATAGAKELAEIAKAADRLGFFYIGVCDHVAIPRSHAETMSTIWYDTMTTLGWLAGITERVRLLSHVAVPAYRHPLVPAKAVATLDVLSNGRAIFGVGAGHVEADCETYGVPFAERGAILDESLDIIDQSLREEFVTWHGARFDIDDMGLAPRPVQSPR